MAAFGYQKKVVGYTYRYISIDIFIITQLAIFLKWYLSGNQKQSLRKSMS